MKISCLLVLVMGAVVWASTTSADLLQAIELVRARDLDNALNTLKHLCPLPRKELSKAADRGDLACQIRIFVWSESNSPKDPKDISLIYWGQGDEAYRRGELDLAEALLDVAIDRDPDDASNWHSIGLVYREAGRSVEAIEAFRRALAIDPDEPYTMYWLATALIDNGQLDEAEETLDNILRVDRTHARVWVRRGEIHMIRGDYAKALQAFKTARKRGVPKKDVRSKIRECEDQLSRR